MAETDNNHYSGSRRVNMNIFVAGVPSFHQSLSRYHVSCLLVLQLLSCVSFKRKRHGQNGEIIFFIFGAL